MHFRQIHRRTLLKGLAGAALSLPFLDAMAENAPAGSPAAKPPLRFGAIFHPNGVYPPDWDVSGSGADYRLSPILTPLEPVRSEVSVLSGIDNSSSDGSHVRAVMSFLTGVQLNRNDNAPRCGTSMDQVLAQKLGQHTRLSSLELGTEPPRGGIAAGLPIAFASSVSWSSPTTKVPAEINPRVVFDRLFDTSAGSQQRDRENRLLIDRVRDNANAMRKAVGHADLHKLDEYLESIYAVESAISNRLTPRTSAWKPPSRPHLNRPEADIPFDRPTHVRLMLDLLVLAFQTDTTRVSTCMIGHGFSRKKYNFIDGVSEDHHSMSHHKNDGKLTAQYTKVSRWHIEQLVYLLQKMQAIDEGGSSLLDNCMLLYGGSLKDGNGHEIKNLPLLLAGRAGGRLHPGRHIASPAGTTIADLHLTLLNKMGVEQNSFAISRRQVEGL